MGVSEFKCACGASLVVPRQPFVVQCQCSRVVELPLGASEALCGYCGAHLGVTAMRVKTIDDLVSGLVLWLATAVRFVLLIVPVVLGGPVVDLVTCWRYMVTASGLQYIWLGKVIATPEQLRHSPNNYTDGTTCFNGCDCVFQLFYGLPVSLVLLLCVVLDVATCNTLKATSRLVPRLVRPIVGLRALIAGMAQRRVVWAMDAFWDGCGAKPGW